MKKIKIYDVTFGIVMIVLLIIVLFPFLWLILSSLKESNEIITYPPTLLPRKVTFIQFQKVWNSIPLAKYFFNTVIFAGGVTLFSLIFDSMAGYAFARLHFKGKNVIFIAILLSMMVPFQVIMIPLFVLEFKMSILNTYWGLIIPRMTSAFGIYMMKSFFGSIPDSLEEAARIDGLNEYQIYAWIMMPLCKPALISLGVILLMNNWNDLIYPLMLTNSTEMRTLSAGLAMFVGDKTIEYGSILAAAALSMLPLLVCYILSQKYFVQGIASTGTKE